MFVLGLKCTQRKCYFTQYLQHDEILLCYLVSPQKVLFSFLLVVRGGGKKGWLLGGGLETLYCDAFTFCYSISHPFCHLDWFWRIQFNDWRQFWHQNVFIWSCLTSFGTKWEAGHSIECHRIHLKDFSYWIPFSQCWFSR